MMNRAKLYISAALFLVITVVKLMSPALATELREKILPVLDYSADYRAAISEIGQRLTETSEPVEVSAQTDSQPVVIQIETLAEHIANTYPQILNDLVPVKEERAEQTDSPNEPEADAVPEAVAAFWESQAAYADLALPASVSYEMPELPFNYSSPVSGTTSSGFGYRLHPIAGEVKFHYGTDFAAWEGTPITCFADGFVQAAGNSDSYGLYLIVNHGDGWSTLYAHCSALSVSEGSAVTEGQEIALAGETGQATGPHLHFELICDNIYYNPEFYVG